jgi:hypothetical protein
MSERRTTNGIKLDVAAKEITNLIEENKKLRAVAEAARELFFSGIVTNGFNDTDKLNAAIKALDDK